MNKAENEAKIVTIEGNEKLTKQKLREVTEKMQRREDEFNKMAKVKFKLSTVVKERDSTIRALKDDLQANHDRQNEIDA